MDCSTFTSRVQRHPKLNTTQMAHDAKGPQKYYKRVKGSQLLPGDVVTYPHSTGPDGELNYGHAVTHAGQGLIVDSSASGNGPHLRPPPHELWKNPGTIVLRRKGFRNRTTGPAPDPASFKQLRYGPYDRPPRTYLPALTRRRPRKSLVAGSE